MTKTVRLVNISKGRVQRIHHMAPLISISDRYSTPPAIPARDQRPLLLLDFFPADFAPELSKDSLLTAEKADKIIKFVEEQREAGAEVIYVQCGEGRIRSFSVCTALESLDGFHRDANDACIKSGILDRYTFNLLGDRVDQYEEQRQASSV
ncbi:hypothetical protein D3C78_301990 [compost metagenome]